MQEFPHHYHVSAVTSGEYLTMSSSGLDDLRIAGPAEFDGPGDSWSPENLMTGAIASCFILTFKAVARASKLDWIDIRCSVEAVLDRVDKVTRFTEATLSVTLTIDDPGKRDHAERIVRKSEENCLVTNSMTTQVTLVPEILVQQAVEDA